MEKKVTTRHFHEMNGDKTVYHDGGLFDCPETVYDTVSSVNGVPVRIARGMTVTLPPDTAFRYRIVVNDNKLKLEPNESDSGRRSS